MNNLKIIKFFSEIFALKRIKRSGLTLAGIENPDSIADHICISSQIAFILGEMEKVDSAKCALMSLFHDNDEVRLGDRNKVNARYLQIEDIEPIAEKEHFENLPLSIMKKIQHLLEEKRKRNTKEGIISQDADWLEVALQAKIYTEQGYKGCEDWINNVEKALETKSAKKILKKIKKNPDFINYWWKGLKRMTYKKLKNKS